MKTLTAITAILLTASLAFGQASTIGGGGSNGNGNPPLENPGKALGLGGQDLHFAPGKMVLTTAQLSQIKALLISIDIPVGLWGQDLQLHGPALGLGGQDLQFAAFNQLMSGLTGILSVAQMSGLAGHPALVSGNFNSLLASLGYANVDIGD